MSCQLRIFYMYSKISMWILIHSSNILASVSTVRFEDTPRGDWFRSDLQEHLEAKHWNKFTS